MDSGSDWDSLPGDDEPSFTLSKLEKEQPVLGESAKSPQDRLVKSSASAKMKREHERTQNEFQSINFEDKSHIEKSFRRSAERRKKKQAAHAQREKLPYTNFQESKRQPKGFQMSDKQQQQQQQQQQQHNKYHQSFDISNSWDMSVSKESEAVKNNKHAATIHGDSSVGVSTIREQNNNNNNKAVLVLSDSLRHEGEKLSPVEATMDVRKKPRVPSVLSLYDVKEKQALDNVIDGKTYYYEKFYFNGHTVSVEDKSIIPKYADRLEAYIRRGWQEVFGVFRIILDFFVIFIVELTKLLFSTVFQKLITGILIISGDYMLKPMLSTFYNSILQTIFVFLWNVTSGVRRFLQPLVHLLGDILEPLTRFLKAFRLFEYHNDTRHVIKDI